MARLAAYLYGIGIKPKAVRSTPHSVVVGWPRGPHPTHAARRGLMDVVVERCAGFDIGKDEIVACVRGLGWEAVPEADPHVPLVHG